jgi:hypothetical protein
MRQAEMTFIRCLRCGEALTFCENYGLFGEETGELIKRLGKIYRCETPGCLWEGCRFHTDEYGHLREGYPG